jgi:hypothetical protein
MDKERVINKWSPIIDVMGYSGSKYDEICLYAEGDSKKMHHYLPLSLKILSKLKNLGKH